MMHRGTTAALTLLLVMAAMAGCQEADPAGPALPTTLVAKPGGGNGGGGNGGGGNGGGGGGGGGDTAVKLTMSGGMSSAVQLASPNGTGASASTYTVDVNLGATYSTDPTACLTEPADLPDDVRDILIGRLEELHFESIGIAIDASAALVGEPSVDNTISLRGDWWLQLGKNNDRIGAGWPTVEYTGDPARIDDPTHERVFTFLAETGDVRVVERYDGNGDGKIKANDPVGHLTCPLSNGDPITVTLSPSS